MCCTDDAHPDDVLTRGHIDKFMRWGMNEGVSIYQLIQICCFNPTDHYRLNVG